MATQSWTTQEQLAALMRLPWTLRVDHDTDGSLIARIAEIPDAIGTGEDLKALAVDLWESLAASLECRLENGDPIPVPSGSMLPWESRDNQSLRPVERKIAQRGGELTIQLSATAA